MNPVLHLVLDPARIKMFKKLVYVLNSYSINEASHFVHVGELLKAISKRGVNITLIIEKGDAVPSFGDSNIEVLRVPPAGRWLRLILLTLMVRRACKSGRSAIYVRISVPAALASIVGRLGTGAKVFFWQSGTVHAVDRSAAKGIARWSWLAKSWLPFRLVVFGCDKFVTGPESMIAYYRNKVNIPTRKLALLYNDINIEKFQAEVASCDRTAERLKLNISTDALMLLFVHRLSPVRRTMDYLPAILNVMRDQPATIAVFAGGGPELQDLRDMIKNAGLENRCRILGNVPHHELARLFSAADVFLNPSFTEGFPRVILEAMAVGLPIVATNAGGTNDIVGASQKEFIVSADEPAQFSRVLNSLVSDMGAMEKLSAENLSEVLRFDTARVAKMYDEVLFE
jgi:glycosyltransferase involved in cell wall biosynthesis